jgi:hypothetical protein
MPLKKKHHRANIRNNLLKLSKIKNLVNTKNTLTLKKNSTSIEQVSFDSIPNKVISLSPQLIETTVLSPICSNNIQSDYPSNSNFTALKQKKTVRGLSNIFF